MEDRLPGTLAVGALKDVLVEALFRFGRRIVVERTQPELEVALVVGRQVDAQVDVGVHFVGARDDAQPVLAAVLVQSRLSNKTNTELKWRNSMKNES